MTGRLTSEIEIKFLTKGDRIRVVNNETGAERFAICTMDGHAVSEDYGWLVFPEGTKGGEHFKDYINVLFEDTTYPPEGSFERLTKPNETLYQNGFTVYVTARRVGQARNWLGWYRNGTLAVRLAEQKIKSARAIIAEQQAVIAQQEQVLAAAQLVIAA